MSAVIIKIILILTYGVNHTTHYCSKAGLLVICIVINVNGTMGTSETKPSEVL